MTVDERPAPVDERRVPLTVAAVISALAGVWLAILTLILHQIPWALGLALAVMVGFVVQGFTARITLWAFVLSWCATIGWSLRTEPGGDVLLLADPAGWVVIGSAFLMPFVALFVSLMRMPRT